jgi:chitin synthase
MHNSGGTQAAQNTALDQDDWYTAVFQPKIKHFYKGPLVWEAKDVKAQASDQDNPR